MGHATEEEKKGKFWSRNLTFQPFPLYKLYLAGSLQITAVTWLFVVGR